MNHYYQDNNGESENENGSGYNYSWNRDDVIFTPHKKTKRGPLKLLILIIFVLIAGSVIGMAIYGGYNLFYNEQSIAPESSGTPVKEVPQISITDIKDDNAENRVVRDGEKMSTVEIVKKVKPSVVGIVSNVQKNGFIGQGSGSGVIISTDGYIVTNQHVIDSATSISVIFEDGTEYEAKIIGEDRKADLAVLKIEAKDLTPAEFGDSDALNVGDSVVAIGNPTGLELFGTTTAGIISAINRNVTIEDRVMTLLQTDAAINRGNSGGPLINDYGQVIGINSAKLADGEIEGLGFAIPTSIAVPVMDNLLKYGYVKDRPVIGITGMDISESISNYYDLPQGVLVKKVTSGSGAQTGGLLEGDIIVKVEGKIVRNMAELNQQKDLYKSGDTITLTIYRDGKTIEKKVVLSEEKPR
jgi:serine protease Do